LSEDVLSFFWEEYKLNIFVLNVDEIRIENIKKSSQLFSCCWIAFTKLGFACFFFDRFWNFGEWLMKQLIVCDQPIETVVKGFSQNVNTIMFQKSSFKILKIQWSCNKENFQLVHSCIFWLDVYVWNTIKHCIQSYLDIKIEIKKAENVAP
jgi:hypothetical protein